MNLDIADRKRGEEALKDADRPKDEFLATLAHELRNPLAAICAGWQLLKAAGDKTAAFDHVSGTIERQTQQLIMLVNDLLDASRISRGKLELRKCTVRLSDVLVSAVESSRPLIDEAGHELTVTIPEAAIYLDADPQRLAQVFTNLLNNAAKYTPKGGRISLSAERTGDQAVISVKDLSLGIPANMLDRVFEMFAQIDRSMQKTTSGLGIGLTLVKSLVNLHGGKIDVYSEGPGKGSEFRVRLLTAEPRTSAESRQPAGAASSERSPRRRVLVVDDNKPALQMLGAVVEVLGHEVRTASDGQEAIDVAREFLPDVVLLDLGMPKMNGYQAARQIREHAWGKTMTLVALTGWGMDEDRRKTKEAGFDYHLVKPADPAELQEIIAAVADTKGAS